LKICVFRHFFIFISIFITITNSNKFHQIMSSDSNQHHTVQSSLHFPTGNYFSQEVKIWFLLCGIYLLIFSNLEYT
jgi:hypothetical protein